MVLSPEACVPEAVFSGAGGRGLLAGSSVVSADLPLSSGSAFTILSELEGALEIIWFKAVVL